MLKRTAALMVALLLLTGAAAGDPAAMHDNVRTVNHAFAPGEKLTYSISWSNIVTAGVSTMEVTACKPMDDRPTYCIESTTRSVGLLNAVYPVREFVESVVDARDLYSLSYSLRESLGGKKRERTMIHDLAAGTVSVSINNDAPKTYPVPARVQDALSALYYLRTRQDFVVGKPVVMDVHDGDKTWSVEVFTLGKERITTPAGAFATIKLKTYPKYEGVFMHKGEIYIWLTDDARRIPVLMKSTISIGSIMATLTKIEGVQSGS